MAGQLDRRIRLATDGQEQFEDVFAALNAHEDRFGHSTFLDILGDHSNDTVRASGDTDVSTASNPVTWSLEQHRTAFDGASPDFRYSLAPEETSYRIDGRYRNVSVDRVPELAVGETLSVPVRVTNDGDADGEYEAELAVNDTAVAQATGHLEAGETETTRLVHSFDESGTYRVSVGDDVVTVTVREPATPSVSSLTLNRTRIVGDGSVTITATVDAAGASIPAAGTVTITRNDTVISRNPVVLAPGQSREIESTDTLSLPGHYVIGAGDRTTAIDVVAPRTTTTEKSTTGRTTKEKSTTTTTAKSTTGTTDIPKLSPGSTVTTTSVPGFTVGLTLLALVVFGSHRSS